MTSSPDTNRPAMKMTDAQIIQLRKFFNGNPDGSPDWEHFKARAFPMPFEKEVAMIGYCGMIVGIEIDGYAHT